MGLSRQPEEWEIDQDHGHHWELVIRPGHRKGNRGFHPGHGSGFEPPPSECYDRCVVENRASRASPHRDIRDASADGTPAITESFLISNYQSDTPFAVNLRRIERPCVLPRRVALGARGLAKSCPGSKAGQRFFGLLEGNFVASEAMLAGLGVRPRARYSCFRCCRGRGDRGISCAAFSKAWIASW
jgi:hypothetical protein